MNVKTEYAKQRQFWEELQDYIGDTDPNKGSKLLSVTDAMIQDFEKPEPMTDPEIVLYIRKKVCEYFKIPEYYLDEHSKLRERNVIPRQFCFTFCKIYTRLSLKEIGIRVGRKDHATVMHGIKVIDNLADVDKSYKEDYIKIKNLLNLKRPESEDYSRFTLGCVAIHDNEGVSAYMQDIPEIIVEGKTVKECRQKIVDLIVRSMVINNES